MRTFEVGFHKNWPHTLSIATVWPVSEGSYIYGLVFSFFFLLLSFWDFLREEKTFRWVYRWIHSNIEKKYLSQEIQ